MMSAADLEVGIWKAGCEHGNALGHALRGGLAGLLAAEVALDDLSCTGSRSIHVCTATELQRVRSKGKVKGDYSEKNQRPNRPRWPPWRL